MRVLFISLLLLIGCIPPNKETERWWSEEERSAVLNELDRTTDAIRIEIENLSPAQWTFRESPDRWNIAEIIEHLEMQNQLHYREISIVQNSPQALEYRVITAGNDEYFTKYATDTIKGQANWFLQPKGKFISKNATEDAFYLARSELRKLVVNTDADLRKQFTFRAPAYQKDIEEVKIGEVRDLHQLLLTGIAHTDRHLDQIRMIKVHPQYPNGAINSKD